MYIPFISEVCKAAVIASQILFCILAAAKVVWNEEKCYKLVQKCFKLFIICNDDDAARIIPFVQTMEVVGLISWVIYLCQAKG